MHRVISWVAGILFLACVGVAALRAADSSPADACNQLGLELLRKMTPADTCVDAVLSPYSVERCLLLGYEGAGGPMRARMAEVLGVHLEADHVHEEFRALDSALKESTHELIWNEADGLYAQTGIPLRPAFAASLRGTYGAEVQSVDFQHDSAGAVAAINQAVANTTAGRIQRLLADVGSNTSLVLAAAVYFKAGWGHAFDKLDTHPETFFSSPTASNQVPMMRMTRPMIYQTGPGFRMIALPYQNWLMQLVVILPDDRFGASAVARRLDARWLMGLKDLYKSKSLADAALVEVYLPKFSIQGDSVSLVGPLKELGLGSMFNDPPGSADFSGAAETGSLKVSDVRHEAWLQVDEKGSEAAAATVIKVVTFDIEENPAPPPKPIVFRVDHPFLFAIQDRKSGVCLFLGSAARPGF